MNIWKNPQKSKKSCFFQKKTENSENICVCQKRRGGNAFLLVFPIEEISLWLELSSPTHFRFQWGYPERYERRKTQNRNENIDIFCGTSFIINF